MVRTTLPLGVYSLRHVPLLIVPTVSRPQLNVRQPTTIEYALRNLGSQSLELKYTIERVEAVMFDGYAEVG